ncbi:hypothetical protein TorRG33x02_331660 [Trema orientale]|uniref:DUF8039 domain-containing protein n=1 Tax=Trema orientale TaxID=63057 RepID=A0A2P5B5R3_TREOI|nr:hypothetical protein TorRG33x02_331660 [Trema orientale]
MSFVQDNKVELVVLIQLHVRQQKFLKQKFKGNKYILMQLLIQGCQHKARRHIQDSLDGTLLCGRELGENNYRVSIEIALIHNAPIPIPNPDDFNTINVGLALGSHVAWPKSLVIFNSDQVLAERNKKQPKKAPTSQPQAPLTQERAHLSPRNKELPLTQMQGGHYDTPVSVRLLLKAVEAWEEDNLVHVPFPADIFREVFQLPVFKDDILRFCKLEMIRAVPITLYMR